MQSNQNDSDVKRYKDESLNVYIVQLLPGQCYASASDEHITTVLGSCIAVCLRDKLTGIGGMNHFMLPGRSTDEKEGEVARFGTHAMEILINDLLKLGADKSRLVAKIFGGGDMLQSEQGIGVRNAAFAKEFLVLESIDLVGEDIGNSFARKIRFAPKSGKVMVKKLRSLHNKQVQESEQLYASSLSIPPENDDLELFG